MNKHGGKRDGAGRPTPIKKGNQLKVYVSEDVSCTLDKYSKFTGSTKSDIVEMALHTYMSQSNPDFVFCPKCHEPVAFLPVIPYTGDGEIECHCNNCGKDFIVKE